MMKKPQHQGTCHALLEPVYSMSKYGQTTSMQQYITHDNGWKEKRRNWVRANISYIVLDTYRE